MSTPRAPRNGNEHKSARRDLVESEIYEHASRLFAKQGFAGTSFQDIADAVGLTRPALYYYLKSKEDLLAKLVSESTEGPASAIREVASRGDLDAAGKLHEIVKMNVTLLASHPVRFQLLIRSEADLPADLAKLHRSARRTVLKTLTGIIDDGIVAGLFRPVDAKTAAFGLIGMINWVAWWFQPDKHTDVNKIAEQLADMAVASLRREGNERPETAEPAAVLKLLRQEIDYLERLLSREEIL